MDNSTSRPLLPFFLHDVGNMFCCDRFDDRKNNSFGFHSQQSLLPQGPQSSIALKRSMLRVANNDHMCLAMAIGRCFVKLCKIVTLEEFKRITKNDQPNTSATMKMVKHRVLTKSYLAHIKLKIKGIFSVISVNAGLR